MHHNISIFKQSLFSVLFIIFAIAGPFVSANSNRVDIINYKTKPVKEIPHAQFFCGEWAGKCDETQLKNKINFILSEK
tara:strand:- start:168 stop:401 length:234 start_codon:yes stop_codon:yes gene_type:complete